MNTPTDRPDPLDPHELELARILRALPGGEPPAALDARILRSAQDALSTRAPRRRALWGAGATGGAMWGIGSAAAAILAVGIGWRLSVPPDSNLPVPRTLPTAVDSAEEDSTAVDFVPMPQRLPDNSGPPPPMAKLEVPQSQPRPVTAPPPPPMAPAAMEPEPFPESLEEKQTSEMDTAVVTGARRAQEVAADAAAPAPAAAGGPAVGLDGRDARTTYSERRRDEALGQLSAGAAAKASAPAEAAAAATGTAEREALADADNVATRVQDDRALAAEEWLTRIRARRDAGDVLGARASLRLFATMHPERPVPVDLRPLLDE